MCNCKCQQHVKVYFIFLMKILKKKNQPSHPYLSYRKHLLTVQHIVCLCNTVLRFPVCIGVSSIHEPCLRGRSLRGSQSSSWVAGRRRQLGCKQPGSFPGKSLAAGRVSLVAAGGHKEAGDTTKLHMWLAENWCQMVPTRPTPYDHNPHLRFSCRADNIATVKS